MRWRIPMSLACNGVSKAFDGEFTALSSRQVSRTRPGWLTTLLRSVIGSSTPIPDAERRVRPETIYWMTEKLSLVLSASLLQELAFDDETLKKNPLPHRKVDRLDGARTRDNEVTRAAPASLDAVVRALQ
jgi:hypothetical protein